MSCFPYLIVLTNALHTLIISLIIFYLINYLFTESKLIQPSQSSPQSHSVKRNLTRKGSERLNNSMDRDSGHNHKAIHRRAYSLRAPAVPRKPRSTGYYVVRHPFKFSRFYTGI